MKCDIGGKVNSKIVRQVSHSRKLKLLKKFQQMSYQDPPLLEENFLKNNYDLSG